MSERNRKQQLAEKNEELSQKAYESLVEKLAYLPDPNSLKKIEKDLFIRQRKTFETI